MDKKIGLILVEARLKGSKKYDYVMTVNVDNDEQFNNFQVFMIQATYHNLDVRLSSIIK